jgi:hypothetical protein
MYFIQPVHVTVSYQKRSYICKANFTSVIGVLCAYMRQLNQAHSVCTMAPASACAYARYIHEKIYKGLFVRFHRVCVKCVGNVGNVMQIQNRPSERNRSTQMLLTRTFVGGTAKPPERRRDFGGSIQNRVVTLGASITFFLSCGFDSCSILK